MFKAQLFQDLFIFQFAVENTKITVRSTKMLPAVLYGNDIWSFTLRLQQGVRMLDSRELWKVFVP
jgi:hypothetical protein